MPSPRGIANAILLLTGCCSFIAGGQGVGVANAQTIATVTVNPNSTTTSIAPSFLGLSLDLAETQYMIGTSSSSNAGFKQLVKNLTTYANGPIEIRELSDEAFSSTTTANDLPALSSFYSTMQSASTYGVKYWVGVDFADNFDSNDNDNGTAASQAETIYNSLPSGSLLSYEIGNEPDLYAQNSKRSSSYDYSQYKSEYEQAVAAIEAKNTGIAMAAPVFSGFANDFIGNLDDFIAVEQAHLGMLNLHYYGGSHCNGKTVASDYLMTDGAVNYSNDSSRPNNVAGYISALNQVGRGNFRIGEMNSVACSGQDGVSNTFQSALWFLDEAMSYATAKVSGVNLFTIHNSAAYYSPFKFAHTGTFPVYTYSIAQINPVYYGMLTTAIMLQSNAALLPVDLSTSLNIKAYATKDSAGIVRVLLINKEEASSGDGNVSLTVTGRGNAALWQLLATNNDYRVSDYTTYTSDDKITLAGQTFKVSSGTQDGLLHGTETHPSVTPSSGVYTISVPHSSAVVVKIP